MEVMKSSSNVADSKQQQEQEEQQQKIQEQHFHVLAVDDSLIDRKLLERLLKGSSYKVTCVDSGDEALKFLGLPGHDDLKLTDSSSSTSPHLDEQSSQVLEGSKVINLIMTDYCMPGMSGYDLLKRVKGSSWKDIPVVVMSSENVPSRINMCLEEGAEEFLLKPLQISDLKKLRPYLLKSLEQQSTSDSSIDINHGCDALVVEEIDAEDHNGQGKISDEINKSSLTMNNSNASISKRKAVSTETTSERLPKMKGLVVA